MKTSIVIHSTFVGTTYGFYPYIEGIMVTILEIKVRIRLSSSFFSDDIHHTAYTTTSIERRRGTLNHFYTFNGSYRHHIVATHIGITLPNWNFPIYHYQGIAVTSRVYTSESYSWTQASSIFIYIIDPWHKAYGISYSRNCQLFDLCSRNYIYRTSKILDLSLNSSGGYCHFREFLLGDLHLYIEQSTPLYPYLLSVIA